jgi:hypothetical protein
MLLAWVRKMGLLHVQHRTGQWQLSHLYLWSFDWAEAPAYSINCKRSMCG